MRLFLLLAIFFLSGAAGLVYEVLWTRQLALIFGVTTYAVSAVLATFMGGLALGSFLVSRRADRMANPILAYAVFELGIGLYALAIPWLLETVRPLHVALARLDLPFAGFALLRGLLGASILLVPTTLMGATFPVLVRHWANERGEIARGTGVLYFTNTAGAIAGCVLCGFVFLERLGLSGTNLLAATLNVSLAAAAALLSRRGHRRSHGPEPAEFSRARVASSAAALLLVCAGISGFVSLTAQVLWSRALLRYLYNSTYAFTTMLATFLVGIAVGSAIYGTVLARSRRPLWWVAALLAATGLGFAVSLALFPHIGELASRWLDRGVVRSFSDSLTLMFLRSALVLLPPVVCLGALFPLVAALHAEAQRSVGHAIGRIYAVNTLGCIVGSLGCAFVAIPLLGMWGTHQMVVLLCLAAAGVVAGSAAASRSSRVAVVAVASMATVLAWKAAPEDVFRRTFLPVREATLAYYEEGATDTVGVMEYFGQRTIVYEDLRGTASTITYGGNYFLGHLPMLLHRGPARRVLHICFGVGNSLAAVAGHDELERVDNVELSPHVVGAGPYFWTNDRVLEHPKVRTIIDDGRNFLMTTTETYDAIVMEPPETFTAGVVNLYTVEFYREALARLAPGGLMMQWVPTANAPLEDEKRLLRAFADVFPQVSLWWQPGGGCALLVGTREPQRLDYAALREHLAEPRVRRDMALGQIRDVDHLLSHFVFGDAEFRRFVEGVEPTTDDRTVLDFSMPRYVGSGYGLGQFNTSVQDEGRNTLAFVQERVQTYRSQRTSVLPYLDNTGRDEPAAIARRIEAASRLPIQTRWYSEAEWLAGKHLEATP